MEIKTQMMIFGVIALIFLIWNCVVSVRIMNFLNNRGEKVNPATMHVQIFKSAKKYREFTTSESGKPGKHYGPFWISLLLFALFLFLGILCALQEC
ncbi:hypothetical protein OU798_10060 [Prolixibacteraceae bacterium Z1-6]|uniref:Uncharacterized protein n=1 Tax=Draconibacterium aestuarii TaxID=2998507 RepID=A0A9X3J5R8_9BACT|nr:hypothetical protein [Prolixibacteraceae bacterium Z1-6]